jgi:hypothetical protein
MTDARWVFYESIDEMVEDGATSHGMPYVVVDHEKDARAAFWIRGDAQRYCRDRTAEIGSRGELADARETEPAEYVGEAARGDVADLRDLIGCIEAESQYDLESLSQLGVETDPADDPETAREEAEERLYELPLCVDRTVCFEIVLGTGGPDRRLVIECDADSDAGRSSYEIRRVLYRYSWSGSAEIALSGDDRKVAEDFARRVVSELAE